MLVIHLMLMYLMFNKWSLSSFHENSCSDQAFQYISYRTNVIYVNVDHVKSVHTVLQDELLAEEEL